MSTRHAFYRRRFLNRPRHHLGAHVIASIEVETPAKGRPYVEASVHVTDCSRAIDLDFSAGSRAEARNALHKVRLLREVLADFEASLALTLEGVGYPRRP